MVLTKVIVFSTIVSQLVLLSACTSLDINDYIDSPSSPSSPPASSSPASGADSRLTNNHEAQFFSRSGLEACAAGAFAAVVVCQISNASDKKACSIKAGLAACGVAIGYNYYLDARRAEYANAGQRLDVMIADVQEDNRKLRSLQETTETVIAEDRRELVEIKKSIADNTLSKVAAEEQLQQVDANIAYLQKTLVGLKDREQQWLKVAAAEENQGAKAQALTKEITAMQKQVAMLESDIDELYGQRSAIKLG